MQLTENDRVIEKALRDNGVLMLETFPGLLTERLINEYQRIKMRNQI